MNEYFKLRIGEQLGHTVEVKAINEEVEGGVATTTIRGTVRVFYGNPDGSDDCEITAREFNRRFKVTAIICA